MARKAKEYFLMHKAQDDNSELIIFWDNDKNWLYVLEPFL